MKLPAPIKTFFDADKGAPGAPPLAAFASDATVEDEGRTHTGRDAIETWWRAAKAQYRHTAEPREVRKKQDRTLVRAKVTGAFSGSPALLTFSFRLAGSQVAALRIGA